MSSTDPSMQGREITRPSRGGISVNDILGGPELTNAFPSSSPSGKFLVTSASALDLVKPPSEAINIHLMITAKPIGNDGKVDIDGENVSFSIPTDMGNKFGELETGVPVIETVVKLGRM